MRTRSTTIIAAGALIAVLGGLTVLTYARAVESRAGGGTMVSTWTATQDVPAGTRGEDVVAAMEQVNVPAAARPETAISGPEDLTGRIAVRPISQGEAVTATQFGAPGTTGAAPASGLQIPPGHNAVTINLPVPQGVARHVQPGDLVNIYATFKGALTDEQGNARPATTKLMLSNVQVLSNTPATTGSQDRLGQPTTGEVLLTVALPPADAERLVFARENASLWFGLVHPGDGPVATDGQTGSTVIR